MVVYCLCTALWSSLDQWQDQAWSGMPPLPVCTARTVVLQSVWPACCFFASRGRSLLDAAVGGFVAVAPGVLRTARVRQYVCLDYFSRCPWDLKE